MEKISEQSLRLNVVKSTASRVKFEIAYQKEVGFAFGNGGSYRADNGIVLCSDLGKGSPSFWDSKKKILYVFSHGRIGGTMSVAPKTFKKIQYAVDAYNKSRVIVGGRKVTDEDIKEYDEITKTADDKTAEKANVILVDKIDSKINDMAKEIAVLNQEIDKRFQRSREIVKKIEVLESLKGDVKTGDYKEDLSVLY
jgi:hypothetical protein